MYKTNFVTLVGLVVVLSTATKLCAKPPTQSTEWLQQSHLLENAKPVSEKKQIVIAIVDDGVRTSHKDIKDFIWNNPLENSANGMDDDGNGHVNDIHGWDVADNDNDASPPINTRFDFYHGTHLAGIITQIASATYGKDAFKYIKIIPVKSLNDSAEQAYIKSGYEGIEYAINAGADIILTAWGVGKISIEEQQILRKAHEKGVLIVASAGNFSENRPQYPAADPEVISVAALDANKQKTKKSNFGKSVDLSAFGLKILSASFKSDNEYESHEGTSQAAAIVAAAAAIVKLQNPDLSLEKIKACLKNSSDVIDELNPQYSSQLGAGAINIKSAVACALLNENIEKDKSLRNPQGYLYLKNKTNQTMSWIVKPYGQFKGFRFKTTSIKGDPGKSIINFFKDTKPETKAYLSYPLAELPENVFLPGTTAVIRIDSDNLSETFEWLMEYKAEPIDFSKLYCKDTVYLKTEGTIEDGSGTNDYSNNSDCKWLITAPEGKVIHFNFTELDTEGRTDLIYFFNGTGTHNSKMAIFSGADLPPQITTWRNQALVWFVTDSKNQGKGWKAEYRFVDPK